MATRYRLTRPNGQSLVFDAVARLSVSNTNRVTDHPTESGVSIADHVQALPLEITLAGIFTESPLDWQAQGGGLSGGGPGRVNTALTFFEDARFERLVLSGPRLPRGAVGDLVLVRWPYDLSSNRSVQPTVTLKQVRIALARQVRIDVSQPVNTERTDPETGATEGYDAKNELADEVDLGEQPTETVEDDAQAARDQSILSSWTDWLFGEGG
ncbi:MAG: phage baseplate protein [Myxococcota bacterium]